MFNDIYEIRDMEQKPDSFLSVKILEFKPDKSLPDYVTKLIPHMISQLTQFQ